MKSAEILYHQPGRRSRPGYRFHMSLSIAVISIGPLPTGDE
ncbi:MAG TPA: hypothetical protein VK140_09100 [Ktedonobacteraceae bacterium]|nr:hypothetical protein [Ktedonobacteraceae bacterium]